MMILKYFVSFLLHLLAGTTFPHKLFTHPQNAFLKEEQDALISLSAMRVFVFNDYRNSWVCIYFNDLNLTGNIFKVQTVPFGLTSV